MLGFGSVSVTIAVLSLLQGVRAGAGAVTNTCVYISEQPSQPFTVDFTVSNGLDCMKNEGNSASVYVDGTGMFCASTGYVETKTLGHCAGDYNPSYWDVDYSGGGYSGHAQTQWRWWFFHNNMFIEDPEPNVYACNAPELCDSTTVDWTGTPTLYVVFQAVQQTNGTQSSKAKLVRSRHFSGLEN